MTVGIQLLFFWAAIQLSQQHYLVVTEALFRYCKLGSKVAVTNELEIRGLGTLISHSIKSADPGIRFLAHIKHISYYCYKFWEIRVARQWFLYFMIFLTFKFLIKTWRSIISNLATISKYTLYNIGANNNKHLYSILQFL